MLDINELFQDAKIDEKVYINFAMWLDSILTQKIPESIAAINFNLYEGISTFHIQMIGSTSTPDLDEDWACDNTFTTGENIFILDRKITGESWEDGLAYALKVIKIYLEKGKYNLILRNKKFIGAGFVDGDIEILYEKNEYYK